VETVMTRRADRVANSDAAAGTDCRSQPVTRRGMRIAVSFAECGNQHGRLHTAQSGDR
jgi:hypothetical protein